MLKSSKYQTETLQRRNFILTQCATTTENQAGATLLNPILLQKFKFL